MKITSFTASKWVHPTTGQVRVYVNAGIFAGGVKVYAIDDGKGYADVVITGCDDKRAGNIRAAFSQHVGLYPTFSMYLVLAEKAAPKAIRTDRSYGSKWSNAYEMAHGHEYGE